MSKVESPMPETLGLTRQKHDDAALTIRMAKEASPQLIPVRQEHLHGGF